MSYEHAYNWCRLPQDSATSIPDTLRNRSADGWELVAATTVDDEIYLFWKRPAQ